MVNIEFNVNTRSEVCLNRSIRSCPDLQAQKSRWTDSQLLCSFSAQSFCVWVAQFQFFVNRFSSGTIVKAGDFLGAPSDFPVPTGCFPLGTETVNDFIRVPSDFPFYHRTFPCFSGISFVSTELSPVSTETVNDFIRVPSDFPCLIENAAAKGAARKSITHRT